MAYHGDFWILIGTAAPVVALAHVVALAPSRRLARELRTDRSGFFARWARSGPIIFSVLGLLGSVDTLALALTATHDERDGSSGLFGPAGIAEGNLLLAILSLGVQAVMLDRAERRIERVTPHHPKPGPGRE